MIFRYVVLVECENDVYVAKNLVRTLNTYSNSNLSFKIRHVGGKSEVLRYLFEKSLNSIGIVDHDPGAPWPKKYKYVADKMQDLNNNLYYYMDPGKHLFIIIFSPKLEEWLLRTCNIREVQQEDLHRRNKLFVKIFDKCSNRIHQVFHNLFDLIIEVIEI